MRNFYGNTLRFFLFIWIMMFIRRILTQDFDQQFTGTEALSQQQKQNQGGIPKHYHNVDPNIPQENRDAARNPGFVPSESQRQDYKERQQNNDIGQHMNVRPDQRIPTHQHQNIDPNIINREGVLNPQDQKNINQNIRPGQHAHNRDDIPPQNRFQNSDENFNRDNMQGRIPDQNIYGAQPHREKEDYNYNNNPNQQQHYHQNIPQDQQQQNINFRNQQQQQQVPHDQQQQNTQRHQGGIPQHQHDQYAAYNNMQGKQQQQQQPQHHHQQIPKEYENIDSNDYEDILRRDLNVNPDTYDRNEQNRQQQLIKEQRKQYQNIQDRQNQQHQQYNQQWQQQQQQQQQQRQNQQNQWQGQYNNQDWKDRLSKIDYANPKFVEYLIGARGGPQLKPYDAYDKSGNKLIGFGHKWQKGDPNEINLDNAFDYLREDLQQALESVKKVIPVDDYDKLSEWGKELLTDVSYNLGPQFREKVPKFVQGILRNDTDMIRREYERFKRGNDSLLQKVFGKNTKFADYFNLTDSKPKKVDM